jgi:hypothetical protein
MQADVVAKNRIARFQIPSILSVETLRLYWNSLLAVVCEEVFVVTD